MVLIVLVLLWLIGTILLPITHPAILVLLVLAVVVPIALGRR